MGLWFTLLVMNTETRFVLIARPANYFPSFEEYSARDKALCYYSDTHKEAYSFRPRNISPDVTAGQIARAEKSCVRFIVQESQWEREQEKARVREFNRKAHLARVAARKVAQTFTLGARWP